MSGLAIVGIVFGIAIAAIGFFFGGTHAFTTIVAGIALLVFSVVLLFIPESVFGQWTEKGRVFYLKWNNFKKFLEFN